MSRVVQAFEPKDRKQIHGVVGGYTATEQSFATSASLALQVLALISLSLGVINLFPFLPLDGGHIFWAVAEKIRGKRIPFAVMERAGHGRVRADHPAVLRRTEQRHLDAQLRAGNFLH